MAALSSEPQMTAWLAGDPDSDRPAHLSPVLAPFLLSLSDNLDADEQGRLVPAVARCVGTAGDGKDDARGWLAFDWLLRTATPVWLDLGGLDRSAQVLRELPVIRSDDGVAGAQPVLSAARRAALSARDAAHEHLVAAIADAPGPPDLCCIGIPDAARTSAAVYAVAAAHAAAHSSSAEATAQAAAYVAVDAASYGVARPVKVHKHAVRPAQKAVTPTRSALLLAELELLDRLIEG